MTSFLQLGQTTENALLLSAMLAAPLTSAMCKKGTLSALLAIQIPSMSVTRSI